MAAEKIVSINVDAPNPRSAYSGSLPVFTLGNTLRMRVELYDGGELVAFDASKDYVFALGLSGRATGGNYILFYGADSTPELSAAASPSDVESALNALAGVSGAGGVKVVGVVGGPYKIFWKTAGARDQIAAKNTLYPDAYVYSSPIVSGDDSTAAQQAIAFKLSLLSSMSNVSYLDVDRTTSTTKYVEVEKPVSVTTKTTVTDPETGETTTTETTETRTETVTEAQVETVTESIKGAMEFNLSLATVEALMALGGSASISALAEFAEISDGGETATLLQAECTILSNVIPDAATLAIASQELANMTASAKFYAIGTNDTPPSIVAGTVPNEADKGSAYYYAQLAANSGADAENSKTSAAESATQAAGAAEDADTSKNTAVSAANGATAAAQASAQSETNAASSASSAQASATNAAQSEADALASKNAAEAAAQIAQETDAGELMLSKLGAGQLWFDRGVLAVPSFANLSISLPISHTLVVCVGGTIEGGKPSHFAWYLDGLALPQAIIQQTMTAPDITSTRALVVAQADNYANAASIGGAKVPIRLARARIFNFQMDADGAPYTVADYAASKPVPPALYDPAAAQRALLALEDYTISRNTTTRLVKDVSGNAYDATVVESGGSGDTAWTGTVKGTRDTSVAAFVDEIKTQFTQSQG